jgi:F-type H+-transporting ATPase subunit epsilon
MPDQPQRELHCVVVTPEKAVLDEAADFVAVPMYDGELGVLPGRAPLVGRLGYGELRLRRGMEVRRFFVDGGFVEVRANNVTVLTSRAMRAEEIDTNAVSQALNAALAPAPTAQAHEEQLKSQQRARAQLRVSRHREEHAARG